MKLEDQCVSLVLSKKLKELGIKQYSCFYWYKPVYQEEWDLNFIDHNHYETDRKIFIDRNKDEVFSAFTNSELGEMLPACIDTKDNEPFNYFWLTLYKRTSHNIQYIIKYICDSTTLKEGSNELMPYLVLTSFHDEKLADALAKMLINLIENKYIALDDINK